LPSRVSFAGCQENACFAPWFPVAGCPGQTVPQPVGSGKRRRCRLHASVPCPAAAVREGQWRARMGLMNALRSLFGGGGATRGATPAATAVEYQGYRITPAPQRQPSGWNTAGVISKEFPDGVKEHSFVRVDTHTSKDDAVSFSITKAQQIIDEQGDRIFRKS
jgi:hypothetical protein